MSLRTGGATLPNKQLKVRQRTTWPVKYNQSFLREEKVDCKCMNFPYISASLPCDDHTFWHLIIVSKTLQKPGFTQKMFLHASMNSAKVLLLSVCVYQIAALHVLLMFVVVTWIDLNWPEFNHTDVWHEHSVF